MKVTIIGLGKTGCSLGLALGRKSGGFHRVGHDREINAVKEAQKIGAIDAYAVNLHQAVQDSELVFLAIPFDQIRETVGLIAEDLKEGSVVVDLCPAKQQITEWMAELLPSGRYYVGWNVASNPSYLQGPNRERGGAGQDYFQQGVVAITAPPGTPATVYELMGGVIQHLGAEPLFADVMEMDGILAEAQVVPQLLSALMVYTLTRQPGWREARKFAAQDFWDMGLPIAKSVSAAELSHTLFANRETAGRLINDLLRVLMDWREQILSGEVETLTQMLYDAQKRFEKWQAERLAANWIAEESGIRGEEIPTSREVFGRLIGLGSLENKKRNK